MTEQRATLIWGPVVDTVPLWKASLGTAYSGAGARAVVQKTHALRTLIQDARPSPIKVSGKQFSLHSPRLLQAAVEARDGDRDWKELMLGPGTANAEAIELPDISNDKSTEFNDILIAPLDGQWVGRKSVIETPPFRLVAGRIRVWIPLAARKPGDKPEDEPWLGYAKINGEHRLFTDVNGIGTSVDGLHVLTRAVANRIYLPAELTPDGIAFFARVPDPLKAFSDTADKVWARVRLFERPAGKKWIRPYALAFEGACMDPASPSSWAYPAPTPQEDHADALENGFASVFRDAGKLGVRIDFDRRPAVPPFLWALETRSGSSRPTFPGTSAEWVCAFDQALFRINVLSTIDGLPSTATLKCDEARLVIAGTSAKILLTSSESRSGKRKITLVRDHTVKHWRLGKVQADSFAAARLPIAEVAKRLRQLYAAADLVDQAVDTIVPAFMPIEHGWLQVPLQAPIVEAPPIARSVLDGTAAFKLDEYGQRGLEVSAARASSLTLVIDKGVPPTCKELALELEDGAGRLRGLVHIADCSPAGGEILPTLRPGATREWPVLFGQGVATAAISVVAPDPALGTFTLSIPAGDLDHPETLVVSWQRDGAWISTRNLAQTRGSGRPVAARSLVPRLVKSPCRLTRAAGSVLPTLVPSAIGDVWDAWAAPFAGNPDYETSQIQPALPGIERHGIQANHLYSLRLDLPPLDDLFANMEIEDPPLLRLGQKDVPGTGGKTALATAAAPGRLREAWRTVCDNHRLTRTRYRYAFERAGTSTDIAHLAMPFVRTGASFEFKIDNGASLPLGSYRLDGKPFAGADALAGLTGFWGITKSGQPIDIDLRGNASERWSPSGSHLLYDLAGTGIDGRALLARPVEILIAPDDGEALELTTLPEPIDLEGDLRFWFRDIPLEDGIFDGSKGVDGFAGDVDARSPRAFARGLYEWRLWSLVPERASDIMLSQGFVARPLRLHRIVVKAGSVTQLELVASLLAPEALDATREREAGETGPAQNLVLVTYVANASGTFQRTVVRVKVENDTVKPFTTEEVATGLDRASFDLHTLVNLTWQPDDASPRYGTLTCAVALDGSIARSQLTLKLFGHAIVFAKQSASTDQGDSASIEFLPPADGPGKIVLAAAQLVWETGLKPANPARFTAEPTLSLPFDGHDGATLALAIDFARSNILWLGAAIGMTAHVDHDKAAISIKGLGSTGSPVIGLGLDQGRATALFAVLEDLTVSGFAHVSAGLARESESASIVLAHAFQFVGKVWVNEMTLDFTAKGPSTIQWPLTAVATMAKRPEDEKTTVSTVAVQSGNALAHRVLCAIRGAAVPTTALDATGRLALPWHLSMRVDHELTSPKQDVLRWTSLDEVMVADLQRLSTLARDGSTRSGATTYGFGARYAGLYRGRASDKLPDMLRPGLFERGLVAAGFSDALVEEALAGSQSDGLVLFGAGISLFNLTGSESVPLALPWLLGMEGAVLGPLAALRQAPDTGTKVWTAAWFDLRVGKVLASAQGAPLALGDPSAFRIASQIEMPGETASARPMLAAVEQPFFEDPDGEIDITEAPLFLRSLMMLAGSWHRLVELGDIQSHVVQPLLRKDGSCRLFASSRGAPRLERRHQLRMVCIGRDTIRLEPPRTELDLKTVASTTTAVLRTLLGALKEPPLLFTLMSLSAFAEEADRLALWRDIELSGRTAMEPPEWKEPDSPALRDPSDRLFVSASLGWPEPPALRERPDELAMGANKPFQDPVTAISGRSASFSSNAGGGPGVRPWIALRLQPVFAAMALPGVMAATPRQLDVVPRRPRLPAATLQPNVVPSRFATISVGYRPGAAHLAVTALKEAGTLIIDADKRVIAHRASYHPVLAGQDRMPRTTVLPTGIENLDWRRETFVLPRGPKCRIEQVPAIAFRTYAKDPAPDSDLPPPLALVVLKAVDAKLDLARGPALRLINEGPAFPDWNPFTSRKFRLRIGVRTWPFKAIDDAAGISLTLETAAAAEAAAYALSATGDTVIACELVLAASEADPKVPVAAPNLILRLPLTIARYTEPVLAVPGATLIFGDPAYDRMLASMTASDTRRIDQRLAILATDRQTYDPLSPVLVSLGLKAQDGEIRRFDYQLTIQRFREGERDPTKCVFEIKDTMKVASLSIDLMVAEGLKSVLPGDRLTLVARFTIENIDHALGLQLLITREPAVPPAPALYHLLTLHGDSQTTLNAATALSASGPTPEIIEYPALEADLMDGYVRRRGLFVWHFAPDVAPYYDRFGYLVKIDRSGAGQLPTVLDDFEAAVAPRSPKPARAFSSAFRFQLTQTGRTVS